MIISKINVDCPRCNGNYVEGYEEKEKMICHCGKCDYVFEIIPLEVNNKLDGQGSIGRETKTN